MKHFSISCIGRQTAASLIFVLITVFSSCNKKVDPPKSSAVDDLVGDYIGIFTMDGNETTNAKLRIEKVNEETVIVRPLLAGATVFRAQVTVVGSQIADLKWTDSETSEHDLTGPLTTALEPISRSFMYLGKITINGQVRNEIFEGNKQK